MSDVLTTLDCGCAIRKDGSRSWCPTCLSPPRPKACAECKRLGAALEALKEQRNALEGEVMEHEYGSNPDEWPDLESELVLDRLRKLLAHYRKQTGDLAVVTAERDRARRVLQDIEDLTHRTPEDDDVDWGVIVDGVNKIASDMMKRLGANGSAP